MGVRTARTTSTLPRALPRGAVAVGRRRWPLALLLLWRPAVERTAHRRRRHARRPSAWPRASCRRATSTSTSTRRSSRPSRGRSARTASRSTPCSPAVLAAPVFALVPRAVRPRRDGHGARGQAGGLAPLRGRGRRVLPGRAGPAALRGRRASARRSCSRSARRCGRRARRSGSTRRPCCSCRVALLFLVMAEDDTVWAGRAGLPLALMVAVAPLPTSCWRPCCRSRSRSAGRGACCCSRCRRRRSWRRSSPTTVGVRRRRSSTASAAAPRPLLRDLGRRARLGLLVSPAQGALRLHAGRDHGGRRAWCARSASVSGWLGDRYLPAAAAPRRSRTSCSSAVERVARRRELGPAHDDRRAAAALPVPAGGARRVPADHRRCWRRCRSRCRSWVPSPTTIAGSVCYQRADADKTAALWDARIAPSRSTCARVSSCWRRRT